ncbi:MAG: nitrogenase component 1 [Synergistaceae bacterium]|nr:nitrogenase component 1 [Synergistaceae bacterium]
MIDLHNPDWSGASVRIAEADFESPYEYGLEYGSPARGLWNIVHTGMLLPESHQIFVCAQGCLRGVVLTAAEMGAQERFSTVAVCENNVLDGDMEALIIDGVTDVLNRLPKKPRAVLVFTSCIHHFMGCDLDYVYAQLRGRFPDIYFTDCYMNPIMRKTKTPPDPMMRMRLYSFLEAGEPRDESCLNIIGNNYPTELSSDFMRMLRGAGLETRDITRCGSFDDYRLMARSRANIVYMPAALPAARDLKERLGQDYIYIPLSYDYGEIEKNIAALAAYLEIPAIDAAALRSEAEGALSMASRLLRDTPVVLDYTATPRPLGLAELLLEHGFNVRSVYADAFIAEERPAFERLRAKYPSLELCATVHPKMGLLPRAAARERKEKIVAIGQKAAYFCDTEYFVNMLEGGGRWGFDAITHIAEELCDAFINEKDTKGIIQIKGWGCCC